MGILQKKGDSIMDCCSCGEHIDGQLVIKDNRVWCLACWYYWNLASEQERTNGSQLLQVRARVWARTWEVRGVVYVPL